METPDTYMDLLAGYSAIWLFIAVYLVSLVREQRSAKASLEKIHTQLENIERREDYQSESDSKTKVVSS